MKLILGSALVKDSTASVKPAQGLNRRNFAGLSSGEPRSIRIDFKKSVLLIVFKGFKFMEDDQNNLGLPEMNPTTLEFDLRSRLGQHAQSLPAHRSAAEPARPSGTEMQRLFARLQRQGQPR